MAILLDNNILAAAEKQIESALPRESREDYLKIVVSGMQAAGHNGAGGLLSGLARRKDPIADCAIGAINLVFMMSKQARGMMPMKVMVPAAMTLMLQALDIVSKAKIAKVGAPELVRATHVFTNHLFKVIKVTPQMLRSAGEKVHGIMQDPVSMEKINLRAGVVRDQRASQPTVLPPGQKGT